MSFLTALRDRLHVDRTPAVQSGEARETLVAGTGPPFDGYERLDARQVTATLSDHSQIELEAIEGYERSHKDREPVLNKLRYMRGREPFSGYDALDADEIVNALQEADVVTIKRVRSYERKFANRSKVSEEVVRVLHRNQAAQPASPAPSYQPLSATAR